MATPEQQAQYDAFVKNGMRLIYAKKSVPKIVKALDGNGDPVAGLASVAANVAQRLATSAKKAGKNFPPEVILHGSGEIVEQLADFSEKSGGHKYTDDELRTVAQGMVEGYKQGQGAAQGQPPAQAPPAGPPQLMTGAPPAAGPPQLMT